MKIIRIEVGYVDDSNKWEEDIEVPDDTENIDEYMKNMVTEFNEEETNRYGNKAKLRKIIRIMDTIGTKKYCDFHKQNLMGQRGQGGIFDLMRCSQCGFEYKRYTLLCCRRKLY